MSPINKKLFRNSLSHVRGELKKFGFNKKEIMDTKVRRTIVPSIRAQAYFYEGEIYIPILQPKRNVRDMLRHEYGHALLFHFPRIQTLDGFGLFGGTSEVSDYITRYAMKNPVEDFCETFMAFIKYKGVLPERNYSARMQRKWRFIRQLNRKISSW